MVSFNFQVDLKPMLFRITISIRILMSENRSHESDRTELAKTTCRTNCHSHTVKFFWAIFRNLLKISYQLYPFKILHLSVFEIFVPFYCLDLKISLLNKTNIFYVLIWNFSISFYYSSWGSHLSSIIHHFL